MAKYGGSSSFARRLVDGIAVHFLPFLLLACLIFDTLGSIITYAGSCTLASALLYAVWPSANAETLYSKLTWNRH